MVSTNIFMLVKNFKLHVKFLGGKSHLKPFKNHSYFTSEMSFSYRGTLLALPTPNWRVTFPIHTHACQRRVANRDDQAISATLNNIVLVFHPVEKERWCR